jgi:hypothetical protein
VYGVLGIVFNALILLGLLILSIVALAMSNLL